jgi:hypothetical protein
MPAPPWRSRNRELAALSRLADQRGAQSIQVQSEGAEVDESALTIYIVSCEKLEELGYSVEGRSAELEIMLMEDESPGDGDVMVMPAVFLDLGPVPLNELTVVMDVRPVREQKVCCADTEWPSLLDTECRAPSFGYRVAMLGNAPHHGGVVMSGNAPHHGGVVMSGNAPHHGGVIKLGNAPHHGGVVMLGNAAPYHGGVCRPF